MPEQETAEKETTTEVDPAAGSETGEGAKQEGAETEDKPLGPAGEKALYAEKERRKAAEKEAREAKAAREALEQRIARLEAGGEDEATKAAREAREQAEAEATAKANERILKAEIRAAAAGKLSDPGDALKFLNLSEFEVGSEGEVDAEALTDAIDNLLKNKPYLSAATAPRFQGGADGGARKDPQKPAQLTRADLAGMSADAINKARAAGQLTDLMSGKS